MTSSYEKSVKGGTKVKLAAPKSKYVEHILSATNAGEAGVGEVFRTLTHRLRDSTWTVAFKSLIIVHLMIKEGARDVTLSYLSVSPKNRLAINTFTDVQTQGQNIRRYSDYLLSRAQAFAATRCDFVRAGEGRMKKLTVDKGLLRETEIVQDQIRQLLKCDFLASDAENEITLTAFRLLTRDLLDIYGVENEAVMNVLSHYFEMSRPDAERSIKIYKRFCSQTEQVVQYLSVARQYEHATRLEIPKIKHAPTSLAKSLQEYLDDKDFEVNRRQYLAEQEAKRTGRPVQKPVAPPQTQESATPVPQESKHRDVAPVGPPPARGPAPDLIDFFESIEQNQEPLAQSSQYVQQHGNGSVEQQPQPFGFQQTAQQSSYSQPQPANSTANMNPFQHAQTQSQPLPVQPQFTGAGFGGYGPQPQQQPAFAQSGGFVQEPQQMFGSPVQIQSPPQFRSPQPLQAQQTSSNPFRQSTMPTGVFSPPVNQAQQRQSTNPFARSVGTGTPPTNNAFAPQSPPQQASFSPQNTQSLFPPQALQAQPTGTNPFARNIAPSQQQSQPQLNALQVQPTGSTNPFRQSAFVNQATGAGWQHGPQGTIGGLEHLETVPVFPRPGQQTTL